MWPTSGGVGNATLAELVRTGLSRLLPVKSLSESIPRKVDRGAPQGAVEYQQNPKNKLVGRRLLLRPGGWQKGQEKF
jgi:uncharacterized protein YidB (DUF937 family)